MGEPRSQHFVLESLEIEIVTRREGRWGFSKVYPCLEWPDPKLQKRAFSAYEHKHWILMRAERAGALPGHARSALAGHRTRGAR